MLEKHATDFAPVLLQAGTSDFVSVDVVLAEALHAEVVDETILFHGSDVLSNLGVFYVSTDETKGNAESIALERTELKGLENALKCTNFDLLIPVLTTLLPNQLLCIHPMNGHSLGRDAPLVLVACNLELLRHLPETLGDVMNGLH